MRGGKVESMKDCVEDTLRRAGSPLAVPQRPEVAGDAVREKLGTARRALFEAAYKRCALIESQARVQFGQAQKKDANADALRLVGDLAAVMRRLMEAT